MCNVFVSKRINKNAIDNEIYFEIEGIKSQTNNETFNAELELDNLSENGATNAGSLQLEFRIYNATDEKFFRKSRFKSSRKSARPQFLPGR